MLNFRKQSSSSSFTQLKSRILLPKHSEYENLHFAKKDVALKMYLKNSALQPSHDKARSDVFRFPRTETSKLITLKLKRSFRKCCICTIGYSMVVLFIVPWWIIVHPEIFQCLNMQIGLITNLSRSICVRVTCCILQFASSLKDI